MSKSRGASKSRKIKRAGIYKVDWTTGQIKKRPFNNKKAKRTKSDSTTHHFEQSLMVIDKNNKEIFVPKTITIGYNRRVFPDKNGDYPLDARPFTMMDSPVKEKVIMVVTDIKEIPVKTTRCAHINNPKNSKTPEEKEYWDRRRAGINFDDDQELLGSLGE